MVENFENQREDLLSLVNNADFSEKFFPDFTELQGQSDALEECIAELGSRRAKFSDWRIAGETIEAEFSAL